MTHRPFVPPVLLVALAAAAAVVAAAAAAPADESPVPPVAEGPVPLVVEARSRAVQPGEPVRVVVNATEPLAEVSGRFLDTDLFFVRAVSPAGGEAWSAWAVVPLDAKPGKARLAVSGRTAAGAPAAAGRTLTVRRKTFPEERLKVASEYVEPPAEVTARIEREQAALKEIYARRTVLPPPVAPFVRPVPGEASGIFGARRIFNGQPRAPHSGLDLRAPTGTEVRSAGPAVVAYSGDLYFSGHTVILDHGGGLFTLYAHLSERRVEAGASVDAGQLVGLSGATGRVTGPHLHWGARVGSRIFDPRALLEPALFR